MAEPDGQSVLVKNEYVRIARLVYTVLDASFDPVLRQKGVRRYVVTRQRVHNCDADRRVAGSR